MLDLDREKVAKTMNSIQLDLVADLKVSDRTAVVVLSGGQDSVTCLALAENTFSKVYAICFDYDQRHRIEIEYAKKAAKQCSAEFKVVDIPSLVQTVSSGLLDLSTDLGEPSEHNADVPSSFVPARNALFLTLAHGYAQEVGANFILTGVCQTDYSGYTDCRHEFIARLENALNIGYEKNITVVTPLMYLNKAETWYMAELLECVSLIKDSSLTCYNGDETKQFFGRGCGECAACKLRAKGYAIWKNDLKSRQTLTEPEVMQLMPLPEKTNELIAPELKKTLYISTKTYGHDIGLSCCFRQWRATHSHCRFLHGYAIAVRIEFETEELDDRNWVVDFGGLGSLKDKLKDTFDHKLLISADDPKKDALLALEKEGVIEVRILERVGCEAFAETVHRLAVEWLIENGEYNRVRIRSVEVKEHGSNSAIYTEV